MSEATAARDVPPGTSWAFKENRTMAQVLFSEVGNRRPFPILLGPVGTSKKDRGFLDRSDWDAQCLIYLGRKVPLRITVPVKMSRQDMIKMGYLAATGGSTEDYIAGVVEDRWSSGHRSE